jgi:hypothetical protein
MCCRTSLLLEIGKTAAKVTGAIGLTVVLGLGMGILVAILKVVMYILPMFELGFLYVSISLDFHKEYIPIAIIVLILNIVLTIKIRAKLKKHDMTLD